MVIAWVLAAGTPMLLKRVEGMVGLRVCEEHDMQGLDVSLHGEQGYFLE